MASQGSVPHRVVTLSTELAEDASVSRLNA